MKTQKIIALFIILIVVIAGVVVLFLQKNAVIQKISPVAQQQTVIQVQDKKITDNTSPFKINIIYPQIAGLDFFNKAVLDAMNKEISNFKTNSLANDKAAKATDPIDYVKYPREYELDISYAKGQIDENIVSTVLSVYNFEGGAHGASYFIPINYNVKSQKEIKLADLFPKQADYMEKISTFCIANLKQQMTASGAIDMTDDSWIVRGAGPVEENYSVFLINPSTSSGQATITFYFPQYQVAAGAAGDFKVTMPR